jgi:ribosomal protein S19
MVNPTGCRNDVILAGLAGAIVGVYLGKNSVGGAIAGGAAGFGIGGFAALKLSADCQPKQP